MGIKNRKNVYTVTCLELLRFLLSGEGFYFGFYFLAVLAIYFLRIEKHMQTPGKVP